MQQKRISICSSHRSTRRSQTFYSCVQQIHCVKRASKRLIKSGENSRQSVLQHSELFLEHRNPLTYLSACCCSLITYTHTSVSHFGVFVALYLPKIREINQMCGHVCAHTLAYMPEGRQADGGDKPSVKLLSQICALYCDSGISLLIVA